LRALAPLLAGLVLLAGGAASAADVVSPAAETVAVTIYRDGPVDAGGLRGGAGDSGLALITESRTVDLPAGRTRIRFEGVADGIVPQSAAIEGLPAGVVERNFDYDLLDPASMLARSVGESVTLRRIDAKTGKVTEERAVVRSAPNGTVLVTSHGVEALHCSGGAEGVIFDHMPNGLAARPTLSALADAPAAGRYRVRLSYLSVRLNWAADYVARIAPNGHTLDLTGWITLANSSAVSFANAPTAVVAGHLSRVAVDLPQPNAPAVALSCWPNQTTHAGWIYPVPAPPPPVPAPMEAPMAADMVVVTAEKREEVLQKVPVRTTQSQLGDYKLYTLVEPTTVAAKQTKQIAFLNQTGVKFDTVYAYQVGEAGAGGRPTPATTTLRFENKTANGLGQPLPQGTVWLRQTQDPGGELFIGSKSIEDVAVDAPFEIAVGPASDVNVSTRLVSNTRTGPAGHTRRQLAFEIDASNAKPRPVVVEIRQPTEGQSGVAFPAESQLHGTKSGDALWTLAIPANGAATLTYTFEYDD
jgi:hypothetical protein